MKIITRKEAKESGLKIYFPGTPCKHGHVASRRTSNGWCCACIDASAQQARDRTTRHRKNNPEYMRSYRAQNAEAIKLKKRENYTQKAEHYRAMSKKWKQENQIAAKSHSSNYRARKKNAVPVWFSEFDEFVWEEAVMLASIRSQMTGIDWHADHMIPMKSKNVSGLHVHNNCQVIPAVANLSKNNRLIYTEPMQWLSLME